VSIGRDRSKQRIKIVKEHNYILSIAGLDPSSDAGITSDIKTFKAHNLYGLSVCTAVTVQNDIAFKNCAWIKKKVILNQIEILFKCFPISVVKIGVIESWHGLLEVIKTQFLNSNSSL
jgi:hydroxymethylpyrimidine/phosphomethylpyrimidine kinase